MLNKGTALLASAVIAALSGAADARTVEVRMLNRGAAGPMVFEPGFVAIAPGDSVAFQPIDTGHNAVAIPAMTPAGGEVIATGFNKAVTVKFTKEGLYGYKCVPHVTIGMVGLVQVGKPTNLDAVKAANASLPPLARARMTGFITQAK